jgi:hypothetical protein
MRGLWRRLEPMTKPTEAETEAEFIFPVLDRLGWHHFPQQTPGEGRQDVADALLFLTEADKNSARKLRSVDRFRHGAVAQCEMTHRRPHAPDHSSARRGLSTPTTAVTVGAAERRLGRDTPVGYNANFLRRAGWPTSRLVVAEMPGR